MKEIKQALKRFFFPPEGTPFWIRILLYTLLGVLTIMVLFSSVYAWDYTNSPEFCGTACHTMPPEYTAYLTSPHARIDCVDCHIGKGFITTRITRKAGDTKHIIRLAFHDYEFQSKQMANTSTWSKKPFAWNVISAMPSRWLLSSMILLPIWRSAMAQSRILT